MKRLSTFSTLVTLTPCILPALTGLALADDAAPPGFGVGLASSIEELVVTATRSPQALYKVGSSITVLNADAIKASQTIVVSDLITQTPGVNFSRNGGVGGVTALRIRGAETDQTVTIIDGVKLNDPSTAGGGYNFGNLLIGDVERIEVLRGAQSTLWGSQAIGGVVAIQTTVPTKELEANVEIEGGSRETGYLRGAAGGKTDRLIWRVAGSHYTTDGISSYAGGTEKDGYRNTGASGRLEFKVTDEVSVDTRAVYSDGRNEFDGFPAPLFAFADTAEYGTVKEFVGYTGLNAALFEGRLQNRIGYAYTDTDRDNFNPAQAVTPVTFTAAGKNKRWEYQGTLSIAQGWSAVFGLENEKSSFRTASPSAFTPNPAPALAEAEITSGYAQVQGEVAPGLTLTGGLRHDDHDTFGEQTLGQAAAAWVLNGGSTILRASYGEGFKAPTLYQLYSIYGNTRLTPEAAKSYDAGVEQRFLDGAVVLSATWFKRDTTNQIDFVSCPSANPLCMPGKFGVYDNIARAKADGLELAGAVNLDRLTLQANYTLTDTENDSIGNANRGKELARRPKNTANLWVSYVWSGDLSTGVGVRYVGDAFDNAANSFVLEDYTLVDIRASYPINDVIEIYGRVENVFDKTYVTTRNYGSPGRGAFAGVRAKF
ncbi:MAG: TonB-dependent receptor [Rhodospirillaceae bacterium]|nr:TonB-dependent receptor [Rhodospirillaceae bacterium]